MFHCLRRLKVCGVSLCTCHHLPQLFRILQHRAGTQHILIERLTVVVCHHHGRLQRFQQCFLANIGIGIMDENTGINITVGINMEVTASACNTAAHIFRVILEIHGKQRLRGPVMADTAVGFRSLLRCRHQFRGRIISHRHIVKIPDKVGPHIDQAVKKLLRSNGFKVCAGVAGRNSIEQLLSAQQFHRCRGFFEHTGSTAQICGSLKALQRDGGNKIAHPKHLIRKGFIDQRTVGEAQEYAVGMLLTKADQVFFAHQRFSSCVYVQVNTQLFALLYNIVDLIIGQIQFIAIFRSPTPGTVQIAGAGGIQQNRPGDIAAVFLTAFLLRLPAGKNRVDKKVYRGGFHHMGIDLIEHMTDIPVIGMLRIGHGLPYHFPLRLQLSSRKFVCPVHQLDQIVFRVLVKVLKRLLQAKFLDC